MRQAVESSSFASIGYSEEGRTLEVEFRDGEVYRYFDVPAALFEEFRKSESKGEFFHKAIKGGYRFRRVDIE